jgi:hypothetical protein
MTSTGRSIRTSGLSSLPRVRGRIPTISAIAARLCIRIGWLYGVVSVLGVRGSLRLQSRSAYVLSVGELAPECRAALSHRRDLARLLCRAGWGLQGTPSTEWAWSRRP